MVKKARSIGLGDPVALGLQVIENARRTLVQSQRGSVQRPLLQSSSQQMMVEMDDSDVYMDESEDHGSVYEL
jgi:hypothetical protein